MGEKRRHFVAVINVHALLTSFVVAKRRVLGTCASSNHRGWCVALQDEEHGTPRQDAVELKLASLQGLSKVRAVAAN